MPGGRDIYTTGSIYKVTSDLRNMMNQDKIQILTWDTIDGLEEYL